MQSPSRLAGQPTAFYSAAQHAMPAIVETDFERPDLAFEALHHDSHEAYLGDIPTPLAPWPVTSCRPVSTTMFISWTI